MNFEEFEKASAEELRKEAHAAFERAAFDRARQIDHVEELNKAQFYLQNLTGWKTDGFLGVI